MKTILISACIILVAFTKPLNAQSVMTISEVTENGMMYEVKPVTDSARNRTRYPNVDINSLLKIKIDKNLIKDQAASMIDTGSNLPVKRMEAISKVLTQRSELLNKISLTGKTLEERKTALNEVATAISPILIFVSDSLPLDNPLRVTANDIFSNESGNAADDYANFFDALQHEIDNVETAYKNAVEANKIYFRLGAFVNKKPVHMEGFDTYKEGEFKKILRFATSISDVEKKNFDKYKSFADEANKNAELAIRNKLKEALEPVLAAIKDSIDRTIAEPLFEFKNGIDTIKSIGDDLKAKIAKTKNDVEYLQSEIKSFIDFAGNTQSPDYLLNLKSRLQSLTITALQLRDNIKVTIDELKAKDLSSAKAGFETFKKSYDSGKQIITNFTDNIKSFFDSQTQLNISITQKIQESLLKLGNEVKKIPLDNIPGETTLNLLTSGERKDGDKLYLKAVIGRQPMDKETTEEKTIEFIPIGLYQIRLHSTINAVLIFADNTTSEYKASSQFQLDPSYSVLFKLGSRQHANYNDFISLGIGMNMATLDFNNDNTPEIGIGIVASAFKDYLQVGYGRNMGSDDFYWFFGVRLPFLGLNLTGDAKVIPDGN